MRSADEWIRWYYRVRDSAGAPALHLVVGEGRVYEKRCWNCGHETRDFDDVKWVCAACAAPWKYVDRFLLKGEIEANTRTAELQHFNTRAIDVGRILYKMSFDNAWVLSYRILLAKALGFTYDDIFFDWKVINPAGTVLSLTELKRRVREAREELSRRLNEAGIPCTTP